MDNEVVSTSTLIIGADSAVWPRPISSCVGWARKNTSLFWTLTACRRQDQHCAVGWASVDTGPDAFLPRAAELRELIDELGLNSDVIEPQPGGALASGRAALRPIPTVLFRPSGRLATLRSRLPSPAGVARQAWSIVLPTSHRSQDPSVADLVRPCFGSEVYDRLVEPLLAASMQATRPD